MRNIFTHKLPTIKHLVEQDLYKCETELLLAREQLEGWYGKVAGLEARERRLSDHLAAFAGEEVGRHAASTLPTLQTELPGELARGQARSSVGAEDQHLPDSEAELEPPLNWWQR